MFKLEKIFGGDFDCHEMINQHASQLIAFGSCTTIDAGVRLEYVIENKYDYIRVYETKWHPNGTFSVLAYLYKVLNFKVEFGMVLNGYDGNEVFFFSTLEELLNHNSWKDSHRFPHMIKSFKSL